MLVSSSARRTGVLTPCCSAAPASRCVRPTPPSSGQPLLPRPCIEPVMPDLVSECDQGSAETANFRIGCHRIGEHKTATRLEQTKPRTTRGHRHGGWRPDSTQDRHLLRRRAPVRGGIVHRDPLLKTGIHVQPAMPIILHRGNVDCMNRSLTPAGKTSGCAAITSARSTTHPPCGSWLARSSKACTVRSLAVAIFHQALPPNRCEYPPHPRPVRKADRV